MLPECEFVSEESYYSHPRPEVLRLVPSDVRQVVDVGCGTGTLGASIKLAHPEAEVRGIEPVREAALRAKAQLDDAAPISADDPLPAEWPVPDCVIFADVLEHLVDPWSTLKRWATRVEPGARFIFSLPNIAHATIIANLLRGSWQYVAEGPLDRTHLRFFTRQSAVDLIEQAGLRIESMERKLSVPEFLPAAGWVRRWARRASGQERDGQDGSFERALLDLITYQFLFRASRVA
jgi:trans-aconitate methyltransferase